MGQNHENSRVVLENSGSSKRLGNSDTIQETQIPLLGSSALQHPNCPRCKNDLLNSQTSGPPVKLLCMLGSVVLCNALPISSLYPFLYFMVDDFHIASKEDIGYYAGAVGSAFMIGRVISSVPWGIFADRYGRKSVFYLGLISIVILQPIFGIVNNFWVALATRFLLGSFNGMLGPLRAYASEVCNAENQAWGLTVIGTSWNLGLIIGPAMGGFLARPAINFPGLFSTDGFFGRFPYLLPSVLQALLALLDLVVVYFMPESIHIHGEEDSKDVEDTVKEDDNNESIEGSLWLHWPLMASVAVYSVWSLFQISFIEIFSLWCVSPKESGGLNMLTSDVGIILAISGFGVLSLQLAIFPPLAKLLGPILVTRLPGIICFPIIIMFPFVTHFSGQMRWVVINCLALLRNFLGSMFTTGSFLLVNNAVPAKDRGAANGISLSAVSVFRAIGPAAAGAIFSWSQSRRNATFLPGSQVLFTILGAICLAAVVTTMPSILPGQVNMPYVKWKEAQREKSQQQNAQQLPTGENEDQGVKPVNLEIYNIP